MNLQIDHRPASRGVTQLTYVGDAEPELGPSPDARMLIFATVIAGLSAVTASSKSGRQFAGGVAIAGALLAWRRGYLFG